MGTSIAGWRMGSRVRWQLMALALSHGIGVPGIEEAVDRLVGWLGGHRADDGWGVNWPYAISLTQEGLPDRSAATDGPSRAAWCYGAPGVARALWLAGVARDRPDWRNLAIEAMEAVYRRPIAARQIDSPTFCHGVAGLLQVTLRFANDTRLPVFAEAAADLTELAARCLRARQLAGIPQLGAGRYEGRSARPVGRRPRGSARPLGGIRAMWSPRGTAPSSSRDREAAGAGVSVVSRRAPARSAVRSRPLYEPLDWALVRAPLLPVEAYLALNHTTGDDGASEHHPNARPAPDDLLPADPRIRAALAVGGGNLYDILNRADPSGKDDPEAAAKLLRYLIRMSTRPTPYGLFAGVALARWGPQSDLALASARPRTRTRPDMAWLLRLVMEAEGRPEVRRQLCYVANPRAFVCAGRVFLPEAAPTADTSGPTAAVSARASNVVRRALALARTAIPHERLVAELATAPGATIEKVEKLIEELWRQTLLLTDLRPPLTEPSPATYVAAPPAR